MFWEKKPLNFSKYSIFIFWNSGKESVRINKKVTYVVFPLGFFFRNNLVKYVGLGNNTIQDIIETL